MNTRTQQDTVHFDYPFRLPEFDQPQPAGDYLVDYDEEKTGGFSWQVWHRVGAFIHIPAVTVKCSTRQMVPINSKVLAATLKMDQNDHD